MLSFLIQHICVCAETAVCTETASAVLFVCQWCLAQAQHAPPFPLDEACGCGGGCLALVIEARHVATPERVDAVAWALLTLHAHIAAHVKRFKVGLRSRLGHPVWQQPVQVKPGA